MDEMTKERALIRALAKGDYRAFATLYAGYLDDLFKYISMSAGSPETAEEIVQDVFLWIWEKRAALDGIVSFKAYIFRAARNRLINRMKREQMNARIMGEVRKTSGPTNAQD